jgi:hypothetical protein
MSVLGLFTLGKSQAQEFTSVDSDGGTTSYVDSEGCTITTHTMYTDSSYHGARKHDEYTTIRTTRPTRSYLGGTRTVPGVNLTRNINKLGDWIELRAAPSFLRPTALQVESPVIVFQGTGKPDVSPVKFRPAGPTLDDAAEYHKNIKSGKWKEFKNGE